jgi:transcriptional regulator with XRE-family HTH domain
MLHPLVTSQDDGSRRSRPLLRTTLGEVLRRTRLQQGRTLADVARAAKVSMQYLSEIERGRKEASSEVLAAICDSLETELPDVLAEVGRELAGALGRRATIVRLGTNHDRGIPARQPAPPGGGDVVCLLAA